MALAEGTVLTTARPLEFREIRIPRPKGGSESEPIRFGARLRPSVFRADMAGIARLRKSAILLLDICDKNPDSIMTLGSNDIAEGKPGPPSTGAVPHTGRPRGILGSIDPPGSSSG